LKAYNKVRDRIKISKFIQIGLGFILKVTAIKDVKIKKAFKMILFKGHKGKEWIFVFRLECILKPSSTKRKRIHLFLD
jgi:hypothetical protein